MGPVERRELWTTRLKNGVDWTVGQRCSQPGKDPFNRVDCGVDRNYLYLLIRRVTPAHAVLLPGGDRDDLESVLGGRLSDGAFHPAERGGGKSCQQPTDPTLLPAPARPSDIIAARGMLCQAALMLERHAWAVLPPRCVEEQKRHVRRQPSSPLEEDRRRPCVSGSPQILMQLAAAATAPLPSCPLRSPSPHPASSTS